MTKEGVKWYLSMQKKFKKQRKHNLFSDYDNNIMFLFDVESNISVHPDTISIRQFYGMI